MSHQYTEEEMRKIYEEQINAQMHAQEEMLRAHELNSIANFLFVTYTQPRKDIIESSPREVYYNKAIHFGLPEDFANKFADAVMQNPMHIDNINKNKGDNV